MAPVGTGPDVIRSQTASLGSRPCFDQFRYQALVCVSSTHFSINPFCSQSSAGYFAWLNFRRLIPDQDAILYSVPFASIAHMILACLAANATAAILAQDLPCSATAQQLLRSVFLVAYCSAVRVP